MLTAMLSRCDDCGAFAWRRVAFLPEDLALEVDQLRRRIGANVEAYQCRRCGMFGFVFEPASMVG